MMPSALIVVTCYRSRDCVGRCVEALKNQTRTDFIVILVDNDTEDSSGLSELALPNNMTIVQSASNTGFAGGSNLGFFGSKMASDVKWVITLNPDAFPVKDWFENLMDAAEKMPEYAMLSSTLLRDDQPEIIDGAGDVYSIFGISWRGGQEQTYASLENEAAIEGAVKGFPVLGPCGAAAAYRADAFISSSGFDEDYFCYLEDVDLALRLQIFGHRCFHCLDAKVLHRGGSSSAASPDEHSRFKNYYTYRNQLALMVKNMPAVFLVLMIPAYFVVLTWVLFRTRSQNENAAKLKGLKEGLTTIRSNLKSRKKVQRGRRISLSRIAKLLVWSPLKLHHKSLKKIRAE